MAQVLLDQGVRPGDCFALLMANHPEFVEAMIAASIVGAAVVPIDPRTQGESCFMLASTACGGVLRPTTRWRTCIRCGRTCRRCAGRGSQPTRAGVRWPTNPA